MDEGLGSTALRPIVPRSKVIAFYGYKGGAGRSLLAANIAATLGFLGKNVLLVDWDLEAPGIGDFLEARLFGIRGSAKTQSRWRKSEGVLELLAACAKAEGRELPEIFKQYLASPILMSRSFGERGRLDLLGPGVQSRNFGMRLMESDWYSFFTSYGEQFRQAFWSAVESTYDFVIIDTRTGINLSTVFVLRFLAGSVFFVSPNTNQALEGSYEMWRLMNSQEYAPEVLPPCRFVLSRHRSSTPLGDASTSKPWHDAISFVKEAFDREPFRLPHMRRMSDNEQLFFDDPVLRNEFFSALERRNTTAGRTQNENEATLKPQELEVAEYFEAFRDICLAIDPSIAEGGKEDLRKQLEQIGLRPAEPVDTEQGRRYVDDLLSTLEQEVKSEAELNKKLPGGVLNASAVRTTEESKITQQKLNNAERLVGWLDNASLLQQSTINIYLLKKFTKSTHGRLPPDVADHLPLSWDEQGVEPESENTVSPPADLQNPEPAPPPPTPRARATAKWREALALRDEKDQPRDALELFKEASAITATFSDLTGEERAGMLRDYSIYVWQTALTFSQLSDWSKAMRLVSDFLSTESIPRQRPVPDDGRTLSVADFLNLIVSIACTKIEAQLQFIEKPLDGGELDLAIWAANQLDEMLAENLPGATNQIDTRIQIARFRLLTAPAAEREQMFKRLAVLYEQTTPEATPEENLWAISEKAMILALRVRASQTSRERSDGMGRINEFIKTASAQVDQWIWSRRRPASASSEVRGFADVFMNCGRPLDAFRLLEDSLQLVQAGNRVDLQNVVRAISIQQSNMGRPDLAIQTWSSLHESLMRQQAPPDSQRARFQRSLEWWPFAAKAEMGDADEAYRELLKHCEKLNALERNPDASLSDLQDALDGRADIIQWLTPVALDLAHFQEAAEWANEWKDQLERKVYLEVDAGRRLAKSRQTFADAMFSMGDHLSALSAVEEGLRVNEGGAEAFGGSYRRGQTALHVLQAEIHAFGLGNRDPHLLKAILDNACKLFDGALVELLNERGWFYTQRVEIATVASVIGSIFLALEESEEARKYAKEALETWLHFPAASTSRSANSWVAKIAATPRAIAHAVLGNLTHRETEHVEAFAASYSELPEGKKLRYRPIFDFCGMSAT